MLNVITIICLVLMVLMFVWILTASHNICGAIQAILDIQHSRNKIEDLVCKRVIELQADKGRLTDENKQAREIIREYVRLANLEKEDTIAIWQLYHKAEAFLKE